MHCRRADAGSDDRGHDIAETPKDPLQQRSRQRNLASFQLLERPFNIVQYIGLGNESGILSAARSIDVCPVTAGYGKGDIEFAQPVHDGIADVFPQAEIDDGCVRSMVLQVSKRLVHR